MIELRFTYICDFCGRTKVEVFESGPSTERFAPRPNPLAHGFTFLENGLSCTRHLYVNLDEIEKIHARPLQEPPSSET